MDSAWHGMGSSKLHLQSTCYFTARMPLLQRCQEGQKGCQWQQLTNQGWVASQTSTAAVQTLMFFPHLCYVQISSNELFFIVVGIVAE